MKKLLLTVAVIGAAFLMLACLGGFTQFWRHCLVVSVPMAKADALIVLGGEPSARPTEAARLYREGVAPLVFVSGVGDAASNKRVLMEEGVPEKAIRLEPDSVTTYTNARFLRPLLSRAGVHSALIVTSPFHTRRALATFRKVIPEIRFGVTDASIGWWGRPEGRGDLDRFALIEFFKTAEYMVIYGIFPSGGGVLPSAAPAI